MSEQSGTQQYNRGRSHIAPKNAWKTLGALLSPFFPKRSGGCAPEAFVVAKQWCSLRDTQVYAVYPLGKVKDLRIPT